MAGGTQQSLRKYLGAVKDTTTVTLAKVNSDYKELDIAIVRATNHVERPAKEKHIKAIFYSISASRPRADVAYCIHALAKRLARTHNWAVALKTLIVIHRALREVDSTFREELINYGRSSGHMLNMSHFKDDSSANAWDYSAWVRTYALFLEERLECFRVLKYDVETDPARTRDLDTAELLGQLPSLQQLMFRLLNCQPQGAASFNFVTQLALSMVAVESVKIYNAISDGTINLVDKFFEMKRHDAIRALDIYRRSGQQAERLSEFYEVCKSIDIGRGERFIKIEQPPASFITAMEEYVKDAPRVSTVHKDQVKEEKEMPKVVLAIEYKKTPEEEKESPKPPPPPPEPVKEEAQVSQETDLLGLHETSRDTLELENKNALALAIVPVDNASTAASPANFSENGTTGWELALVTAPSSNETAAASSKLAGGLDKLTLDSLYDDAIRRANQPASYNPWETPAPMAGHAMQQQPMFMAPDPFYASQAVAAPHSVQMDAMAQQQRAFMQQQQMMMTGGAQQQQQQQPMNPFVFRQSKNSYKVKMNTPKVRKVGKYELGRTIGIGTFARVRFAKNSETGEHVAIKILDKEKVLKHKLVEQIKREIATMKLIKHPNVVRLHEVMGSRTKIFIVLEFITGGELFDKIVNNCRMSEDEARRYFHQLINAVDFCHSRGVYHRDLKPENLLLDTHGNLKISDFGLSALSNQVKADGLFHTTCGTPNYVAPEVLNDRGYDGATADLWSCGVILYVLLSGYLPFDDSNLMRLYEKISNADFACPSWFSSGAIRLIRRILDPNPMTRIKIPEILKDDWFKKGFKRPVFDEKYETNLDDVAAAFEESDDHHVVEREEETPAAMNAFELISMSKGLNLGNLFDVEQYTQEFKRETRFTSRCTANEIVSKIEEAAKPLGFDIHKKNYKMRLENLTAGRKGNLNVATEIFQVAPSLHMVEVRKSRGDTLEFQKFYRSLSTSLKDVVWKSEEDMQDHFMNSLPCSSSL